MSRNCIKCGRPIPEARLKVLPNAQTCVKDSNLEKKVGMPISYGTGDDVYIEMQVLEAEDFKRFEKQQRTTR